MHHLSMICGRTLYKTCLLSSLEAVAHLHRLFVNSHAVPRFRSILHNNFCLDCFSVIARHMTFGQQEDAHEFLRYVIDAMQRACLHGQNRCVPLVFLARVKNETISFCLNTLFNGLFSPISSIVS